MNDLTTSTHVMPIRPLEHPPDARVEVPGSKSLTNRALMIAALAEGTTTLSNALFSDDSKYFARALQALGFAITLNEEKRQMTIQGLGGRIPAQSADLFIGNAGTAARFLTAFLTLGTGQFSIDGDSRMRERPIGHLVDALNLLGAQITPINPAQTPVCPPLQITAAGLPGGTTHIAGNISSQYLSALLMTAPYARNPVVIETSTELNSKPYVDMTLAIMAEFGIEVVRREYQRFEISPAVYQNHSDFPIESDASAASYFFAIPAICGGTVRVDNIQRQSKQGDLRFLDVLSKIGCTINETNGAIEVKGTGEVSGLDLDMSDIPDTAQTLAAIAPFASSPTRIRGIASARLKETDRIAATCCELRKIGVSVEEHPDGMTIFPCNELTPAKIYTYNDHRMAMAFSLIGLRVPGIVIENPGCVSKTFPKFFEVLDTLR
ncbi:3-phosphoshikimate 1-carboxyvinyltransferase [bacterium]|nr:3-phosphoshikimate 1-carboxyvinyltransferase [bacterium]